MMRQKPQKPLKSSHPSALELARLHEADDETSLRLAEVFKVLGDRTRIKLLSLLMQKEELCVCDIAEALGMGQSAISHQLRVLRGARLVKFRKEGKEAFYSGPLIEIVYGLLYRVAAACVCSIVWRALVPRPCASALRMCHYLYLVAIGNSIG